jgi:hypothetical protein
MINWFMDLYTPSPRYVPKASTEVKSDYHLRPTKKVCYTEPDDYYDEDDEDYDEAKVNDEDYDDAKVNDDDYSDSHEE